MAIYCVIDLTKKAWNFPSSKVRYRAKVSQVVTHCWRKVNCTFSPSPPSTRLLPISTLDWLRRPSPHPRSSSLLTNQPLDGRSQVPTWGFVLLRWRDPKFPAAPLGAMRRAAPIPPLSEVRTTDGPLWVLGALCQPIRGRTRLYYD